MTPSLSSTTEPNPTRGPVHCGGDEYAPSAEDCRYRTVGRQTSSEFDVTVVETLQGRSSSSSSSPHESFPVVPSFTTTPVECSEYGHGSIPVGCSVSRSGDAGSIHISIRLNSHPLAVRTTTSATNSQPTASQQSDIYWPAFTPNYVQRAPVTRRAGASTTSLSSDRVTTTIYYPPLSSLFSVIDTTVSTTNSVATTVPEVGDTTTVISVSLPAMNDYGNYGRPGQARRLRRPLFRS